MSVLLYLVPAALSLGLLGLVAFLWTLRSGQYDDIEGAAVRVLSDDDLRAPPDGGTGQRDRPV
ncbi:cbb3-type cytochrome oxidase assembly protein CcoS [Ancylobacter sp. FA202]|uniref:cbb3-type cytochrome oxidase assembly protein CcoS n=1 Tax=Ancylobacter sp. FA202 TaxID=1111106 RepID=UPI00035FD715|nr:cbb3-type cytochrome oxidase assembly protein CcoS [Ancylobacter sp. FA202]